MSDTSSIEWTDTTWNPTTGCDKVSPGCGLPRLGSDDEATGLTGGCYAMTLARRLKATGQAKYQNDGDPRTSGPGFGVTMHPDAVTAPLGWRKPRKVFVNSMSDLFHDQVDASFIAEVFAVMQLTPHHTYQVLTKRHARMRSLLSSRDFVAVVDDYREKHRPRCGDFAWPLPNVWLGVSVETQQWADIRIPALLDTPAAVRWISAEPLLGPVDLSRWLGEKVASQAVAEVAVAHGIDSREYSDRLRLYFRDGAKPSLDWVVTGGESGPGARPMHPDWARTLRDQCTAASVPYFFKQWGAWTPGGDSPAWVDAPEEWSFITPDGTVTPGPAVGTASQAIRRVNKKAAGRELDGRTWDEFPGGAS